MTTLPKCWPDCSHAAIDLLVEETQRRIDDPTRTGAALAAWIALPAQSLESTHLVEPA
jgi:hypothetical protein